MPVYIIEVDKMTYIHVDRLTFFRWCYTISY